MSCTKPVLKWAESPPKAMAQIQNKGPPLQGDKGKELNDLELGPSMKKMAYHRDGISYLEIQSYPISLLSLPREEISQGKQLKMSTASCGLMFTT